MFRAEFKRNNRLMWAAFVCRDLKIDDPIHWMNQAGMMLDFWIAYHLTLEAQSKERSGKVDPRTFFDGLYNGKGKSSRQPTLGSGSER